MTFLSITETILIGPLKLIFEIIFETAYRIVGHPGIAIFFLSLGMNILVLPLYRRADAMQAKARDKEAKLKDGISHIKKMYSGDERMMILQTYYRQNDYKPLDSINGSVSLLIQIPFFIAAYQFLSNLEIFQDASMGPITNLSSPDGLIIIGGITMNFLPILMTLINVVSSMLYAEGFPMKTKIQLYGIAFFFLIFLYAAPACLALYWTLNNAFSLIKNIVYKQMKPNKTEYVPKKKKEPHPENKWFILGTLFLTVLIGLLIPSAYIADSPQEYVEYIEYVDISYIQNPIWYVVNSLCMASGIFLIWMRVFYWLASPRKKILLGWLVWILCGTALVNYMFFGTDLGIISASLQYENGMSYTLWQQTINLLVLIAVAVILYLCARKWKYIVPNALIIAIIALSAMSVRNLVTIKTSVDKVSVQQFTESENAYFQLSQQGRNVIVIMLDRAMGEYIPYIFQEKPEMREKFAGFTYYDNTISFGGHTNFGAPALFGGYEYTPVEMNKRNKEPLVSKHNEALKLMPVLFSENGYDVTVLNPVYANYQWIPDLSIYDDCPGVAAYITGSQAVSTEQKLASIADNYRNFVYFGVMKSSPLFLQPVIYSDGKYYRFTSGFDGDGSESSRNVSDTSLSDAASTEFIDDYYCLKNLPDMTDIIKGEANTFLLMTNDATHNPILLKEPDYVPSNEVDNTVYDAENTDRFIIGDRELKTEKKMQMMHYHANMAAMIQLGNWFDYLRENDVYNNTRIILVSDHGSALKQLDELNLDDGSDWMKDVELYYPLLMVKDFDSGEFAVSDTFMTNADVPTLAMEDLILKPVNPFTGKEINNDEKTAHDQYIILSAGWQIENNNGNTFLPARWASVKDNIWDRNNWIFYDEQMILDEYAVP